MKNFMFFLIIILVLLVVGVFLLGLGREESSGNEAVCTMDAKECSDGSFVGRVAPDCEFTSCP